MSSAEEKKFLALLPEKMNKFITVFKKANQDWKARYLALEDLERLCSDGCSFEGFKRSMLAYQDEVCDILAHQIIDLRSEIVRQASKTIGVVAQELAPVWKKFGRNIIVPMVDVCGAANNIIKGYALKGMYPVLQYCHGKPVLQVIIDSLKVSKNKSVQEMSIDWIRMVLIHWPRDRELAPNAKIIRDAILFALKGALPKMRETAAKCLWLYVGHFPDQREELLNSLDGREKKIVEKGKTEDEEEETAATKIAALMRGAITRRRVRNSVNYGRSLAIGDRVKVGDQVGVLRWRGTIVDKLGEWMGVETDGPNDSNTDGSVGDVKYFDCKAKHGVFARLTEVRAENDMGLPVLSNSEDNLSVRRLTATPLVNLFPVRAVSTEFDSPRLPSEKFSVGSNDLTDSNQQQQQVERKVNPNAVVANAISPKLVGTGQPINSPKPNTSASALSHVTSPKPTNNVTSPKINPLVRNASAQSVQSNGIVTSPSSTSSIVRPAPIIATEQDLKQGHKQHLKMMGDVFQREMDYFEHGIDHPQYVPNMINLLSQIATKSSELLAKFVDYQSSKSMADDEFLAAADNFQ